MTTAPAGKWIEDVAGDDKITRAARKTLAARLGTVEKCLARSTRKSHLDTARVHLLRVSSRRAAEALWLYEDFIPPRRAEWINKQIKRLRKSAGPARDSDVLSALLQSHSPPACPVFLLDELRDRRVEGEKQIAVEYRRLRKKGRFRRRARGLVDRIRPRGEQPDHQEKPCFHDWAGTKLRDCVQRFFDASPAANCDLDALHAFRIRTKKLRYTMELLGPAFPQEFRTTLYPIVETLQNKLGEINDCRNVCEYLNQRLQQTFPAEYTEQLRALLEAWQTRLECARTEFFAWWTLPQSNAIGDAFEEMLADR